MNESRPMRNRMPPRERGEREPNARSPSRAKNTKKRDARCRSVEKSTTKIDRFIFFLTQSVEESATHGSRWRWWWGDPGTLCVYRVTKSLAVVVPTRGGSVFKWSGSRFVEPLLFGTPTGGWKKSPPVGVPKNNTTNGRWTPTT